VTTAQIFPFLTAYLLGRPTRDREVAGSTLSRFAARQRPWESCLHACVSAAKRHSLSKKAMMLCG